MLEQSLGLTIRAGGFTFAGALFWLMYIDLKDALQPEPRHMLAFAFALGFVAGLLGLGAYRLLGAFGVEFPVGTDTTLILAFCLLVIGPVEEGAKFAVTRLILLRSRHFDEYLDGLVYPGAVAIGFAAFENLLQAGNHTPLEQIARAAVAPPVHSVFAMIWGFGSAHAWFRARTAAARFLWQALPLAAAMLLHGLYDFALLGHGATYVASGIVGTLWIAMVLYSRHLVHRKLDRHRPDEATPG